MSSDNKISEIKSMAGQLNSILHIVTTVGLPTVISVFFVFFYVPKHDENRDKYLAQINAAYESQTKSLQTVQDICVNGIKDLRDRLQFLRKQPTKKISNDVPAEKLESEDPATEIKRPLPKKKSISTTYFTNFLK